jgi:peptidoglycan/LPS O-acetylase OafA/YrhL
MTTSSTNSSAQTPPLGRLVFAAVVVSLVSLGLGLVSAGDSKSDGALSAAAWGSGLVLVFALAEIAVLASLRGLGGAKVALYAMALSMGRLVVSMLAAGGLYTLLEPQPSAYWVSFGSASLVLILVKTSLWAAVSAAPRRAEIAA